MDTKTTPWQERFGLTTCTALKIDTAIPPAALGVAVIYAPLPVGETIFLVLESRVGSLRDLCIKRLQTAKIPIGRPLMISFKAEILSSASPEAIHDVCRQQVILAGELRRELRPAMR